MNHYLPLLLLTSLIALTGSCSKKTIQVHNPPYTHLFFGEGGGFTGRYEHYLIDTSGLVRFTNHRKETYRPIGWLGRDTTTLVMMELDSLQPHEINMNDPDNYNYYLEIPMADSTHRIQWSGMSKVPDELKTWYRKLLLMIRSMK